jgi:predicted nuclease of predicted toxin-antitoxin system
MRLLANENIPGDVVAALRQAGHEVIWVRTDAPGSSDPDVLNWAQAEDRVLVTFDKDFGELAFRFGLPASSGIVLFRVTASSSAALANLVVKAFEAQIDWTGHFVVVEQDRIRVKPLPK